MAATVRADESAVAPLEDGSAVAWSATELADVREVTPAEYR